MNTENENLESENLKDKDIKIDINSFFPLKGDKDNLQKPDEDIKKGYQKKWKWPDEADKNEDEVWEDNTNKGDGDLDAWNIIPPDLA